MHVLLICYLAMLFPHAAHAQISCINSSIFTQTGQTNPVGPGPGPLPMDCPVPSVSASSVYSTLTTSSVTLCAPNTPSSASASAKFTILTNNNVTLRIAFQLYKGTSGGYSSLGIYCNSSSSVFFNASNSGQTLTDAVSISGGVFNTSGNYYIVPLVQFYCTLDNSWKTITSGNSSNIVTISILPQNTANNFYLNGLQNTGTIPVLNQCPSAIQNLIMHNITTGLISSYQIKIEKSTNGITFSAPINSAIVNATSVPSSIDLNTLFGANLLNTYTGYLRITLVVTASGQCDNGTFTTAQVFQIVTASSQADFYMYKSSSLCASTYTFIGGANCKALTNSPAAIPLTMPTTNAILCGTPGWQGANSAGISNIDVTGTNSWTLKVYEVNTTTGVRLNGAPDINSYIGSGDNFSGGIRFNDNSIDFDNTQPFYASTGTPINNNYFYYYYNWILGLPATQKTTEFANFRAKTWCVELNVVTSSGCTITNKSFFKIANNGQLSGALWKTTPNNTDDLVDFEEDNNPVIYPVPAQNFITIENAILFNDANLEIYDLNGKLVKVENNLREINRKVDVTNLASGVYFYKLFNNGKLFNGKLIKQ